MPPPGFDDLSKEQQLEYVDALWDRVFGSADHVPTPDWHLEELDRRLANPQPTQTATVEDFMDHVRALLHERQQGK